MKNSDIRREQPKKRSTFKKVLVFLFVICFIFTLVTKGLERIKRYLLRWQNGAEK